MASLFKRLFSSGGGQTASVQVEEPIAETSAEEQTVDQKGAEDRAGKQAAPSEDELKEFLSKNFLDGAKPIEIPQATETAAAISTVVTTEPTASDVAEDIDWPAADEIASEEISVESKGSTEEEGSAETSPEVSAEDETLVEDDDVISEQNEVISPDVTASETETISQVEAAPELPSENKTESADTPPTWLASEDEMMAEIEADSMALDSPEVAAAFADERVARASPPTLTEIPEALRPSLTDVLAETRDENTATNDGAIIPALVSTESSAGAARIDSSEWALEEALGNHKEWLDSRGVLGKKANLRAAKLEGMELISANLRYADLQDANLKAADLLLADLRDACMVRANLQDSCLVGANLEGANLEGASLESAMGLVARQLAGTNLRDASLPAQISHFDALAEFSKASQRSARMFAAMLFASFVSCLMIWKTKDVQLVSDSAILPFLHSPAASAALPTAEIYLIAPVMLLCVYLLFQYHLQRLWDAVLELPAVFPDGRVLGEKQSRIVTGLMRLHFHWMNHDAPSTRLIEKSASALMAYWIVPAVLVLFWGRYLTLQEIHGTILHELLVMAAVGIAFYATTKIGRPQARWVVSEQPKKNIAEKLRQVKPATLSIILFVILTFLSIGTITGVPHGKERAPKFSSASAKRWAPAVLWTLGYDPYADLTEAPVSAKPSDWHSGATDGSDDLSEVKGARLNESHFRYAQAYGIFLANAHLWRSDFYGAFLAEADLRGADFGQADLRLAILDRARMNHTNFDRAQLDGANLAHADMQQAYLWSAKLPNARMVNAQLSTAIFIDADLTGADLRWAQFNGTVLNGASLQNANLDGADLRGALQLGAAQVCSAKSRQGAILDDALQKLVEAQCGGHSVAAAKAEASPSGPAIP